MENQPALDFQGVTCSFVSDDGKHYTAVKDVELTIGDGEFVSVVGPTGCGKSTLLNMAAGLLVPSKGTVKVYGEELKALNKRAGYMFQAEALMPWRTAIDNVSTGLQFQGIPEKERRERQCIGFPEWALPVSKIVTLMSFPAVCASVLHWLRP